MEWTRESRRDTDYPDELSLPLDDPVVQGTQ